MNQFKLLKWIKRLESLVVLLAILALGVTIYADFVCGTENKTGYCSNIGVGKPTSMMILLLLFPLFSITNSLHMWIVYEIKVAKENIFNTVGLVGMTTTYIFYAFQRAFSESLLAPTVNLIKSFIYLMVGITAVIFLNDPHLWETQGLFLKFRVLANIVFIMVYTYSPQIGVLVGLIILPPLLLIPDNTADYIQDTSQFPTAPVAPILPNYYPSSNIPRIPKMSSGIQNSSVNVSHINNGYGMER